MQAEYQRAPRAIAQVMPQTFWEMFPVRTGFGGELFVCETEGPIAHLSQDGGFFSTSVWHEGPEAETVYVERWNVETGQREFHGYVDSVSRKLVQTG
jgi:hypothetical protein